MSIEGVSSRFERSLLSVCSHIQYYVAKSKADELEIQGRRIKVSNLDKVLYPASRFTKGQVIDNYVRVSDFLLPHLKDRPVTLKRYPDGIHGEFFYEKDAPTFAPDWVSKFPVPRHAGGSDICYILIITTCPASSGAPISPAWSCIRPSHGPESYPPGRALLLGNTRHVIIAFYHDWKLEGQKKVMPLYAAGPLLPEVQ